MSTGSTWATYLSDPGSLGTVTQTLCAAVAAPGGLQQPLGGQVILPVLDAVAALEADATALQSAVSALQSAVTALQG